MCAIGLFVLRIAIARPLIRRVDGDEPARVSRSRSSIAVGGRPARDPVYLDIATAEFSLTVGVRRRHARAALPHVGVRPRLRRPRALLRALRASPPAVAIWLDRPERPHARSPSCSRTLGALRRRGRGAGRARARRPRGADRAARRSRSRSTGCTWSPARSGSAASSVCWCSGAACPPRAASRASSSPCRASRTSRSSRCSCLLGTGIGRRSIHMPMLAALWQTSYGKAILVKAALLAAAMLLAAVNLVRTKPRLAAPRAARRARRARGAPAAPARRRRGRARRGRGRRGRGALEPRPAARRSRRRAARSRASGRGRVAADRDEERLHAAACSSRRTARRVPNDFALEYRANGKPVTGADVTRHVRDARHGDGQPGVPARPRRSPASTRAADAGARDGRPLGPLVPGHPDAAGKPFTALVVDRTSG